MNAPTYLQGEGRVERLPSTSEKKQQREQAAINALERRKEYQQQTERAIRINTEATPPINFEGFIKHLDQFNIMFWDGPSKPSIETITDIRILLFL